MSSEKDQIRWSLSRKIISVVAAFALVVSMVPSVGTTQAFAGGGGVTLAEAATFSGGSGTQEDPYLISTAADMKALTDAVEGGEAYTDTYFKMTADVDLSEINETSWTPIGNEATAFEGIFEADNFAVNGLNVNAQEGYAGLFGNVAGTVEDLTVAGTVTVTADVDYVGGITGKLSEGGAINNCQAEVDVTSNGSFVGGIAGLNTGTIEGCFNKGTIVADNGAETVGLGGIAGYNGVAIEDAVQSGSIKNCFNFGHINSTSAKWAGGLVGYQSEQSTLANSYNAGTINFSAADANIYPLIGSNEGSASDCTWLTTDTSDATANYVPTYEGGADGTVTNCEGKSDDELKAEDAVAFLNTINGTADAQDAWLASSADEEAFKGYPVLLWQKEYTVTFVCEGAEIEPQTVKGGKCAVQPEDPEVEGHTFVGWFTDETYGTEFAFEDPIIADTEVYAQMTINVYNVTFESNGGTEFDVQEVTWGELADEPSPEPEKEGYDFRGWYTDEACTQKFSFDTPIKAETTLYARWTIQKFEVTFESNGGSDVEAQVVDWNTTAKEPTAPTRDGYEFEKWCKDEECLYPFQFSTPITEDKTLYAKWKGTTEASTDKDGTAKLYDSTLDSVINVTVSNTAGKNVSGAKVTIADNGFLTVQVPTVTLTSEDAELAATKYLSVFVATSEGKYVTDRPVTVKGSNGAQIGIGITDTRGTAVVSVEVDNSIPVYRLYNPYSGEHLFTTDADEKDGLVEIGWRYEDVAWKAALKDDSKTPVYRLYNKYNGEHFYTTDKDEYDSLGKIGWNKEGTAWYSDDNKGVKVYRLFNPWEEIGTHLFTTSEDEYNELFDVGWNQEEVAFYGVK